MSYANQKTIKVNKLQCDAMHIYSTINLWALQSAMQNLTKGSSLKLWLYLAKNKPGYIFDLSREDCVRNWGIRSDSYYSAVRDLIDKEYLVETTKNHFMFFEIPLKQPQEKPDNFAYHGELPKVYA